jgi:hypothetical protein
VSDLKKTEKKKAQPVIAIDPVAISELKKAEEAEALGSKNEPYGILGQIVKSINQQSINQVERMAFEVDPHANYQGAMGFYKLKQNLTPDSIIKKITGPGGDELVNQILQIRSNHVSSFGRPRIDRFSNGFDVQDMDKNAVRSPEEQKILQEKIEKVKKMLWNCGKGTLDEETDRMNLSQFLKLSTRDGVAYGRFATEFIWHINPKTAQKELYAWRAADAGTIYKMLPQKEQDQSLRREALRQLQQLKNKKIDVEKYTKDEYRYVQVVDLKPVQAFTEEELVVYNLYPTTNIEHNGYPLTPIDQALNAITTHINITMHNKLYFQNGRAAKGMLIFKSDSADEAMLQRTRLQFQQSINSVSNSWRTPVFAVGQEDEISWQQMDQGGRDAEFQYLMDNNARVILSAFQMSPEEVPSMGYLARGTNTQALGESDNEWKLNAARDIGIRPLLYDFQDFLNTHILPKIDPELAKTHQIVLTGLEKDSPEKENTRLQQDMAVHMSYNDIMKAVEKNLVPTELGADLPMNPQYQQILDKYVPVGVILENFFKIKGAAQDPRWNYVRDPFYFQKAQMDLQKAQAAMQQQMMMQQQMQQQAMMAQGQPEEQQDGQQEEQQDGEQDQMQKTEFQLVNYAALDKSLKNNHNSLTRQLLRRHKELVNNHMDKWKEESKKALEEMSKILKDKKD